MVTMAVASDRVSSGRPTIARRAARLCAVGGAVACLAALTASGPPPRSPPTPSPRRRRLLDLDPKTVALKPPGGDTLCVASACDGRIASAAVLDDGAGTGGGFVGLALPPDYAGPVYVLCTSTDQETGEVTVLPEVPDPAATLMATPSYPAGGSGPCDPFGFQPGYYDEGTMTWHDRCTGRTTDLSGPPPPPTPPAPEEGPEVLDDLERPEVLAPENCPIVAERKVVWVHFMGDSVTRGAYLYNMLRAGINLDDGHARRWRGWLVGTRLGVKGDGEYQVWFSFQFCYLLPSYPKTHMKPVRNWHEFTKFRKEKHGPLDPPFEGGRTPDVVLYGPGYHSSARDGVWYQNAVAMELNYMRSRMDPSFTSVHLLLNMMPAPWLIPEKYSEDFAHRTEINEYRKNLGIMAAARGSDLAKSVVDAFSAELPFNGEKGQFGIMGHADAVHMQDWRIEKIIGEMIVDRLCHSGSNGISSVE